MDKQEPTFESAASGAEAQAEPGAGSKPIDAEAVSDRAREGDEKVHNFPLAIYKPSTQYRRFALLAASIALAAAFGGLAGSLSTYSLATPKTDPAERAHNLQAVNQQAANLQSTLTQVTKDVAALKSSVEASGRTAASQMSKLNDRFDRAQAEPAAKIAALTETVSRLEKRIAANADASRDITGSVPDRTAAVAAAKDQPKQAIVEGWVLRDVYHGRAMVENRNALYEVVPGADLPGVGKVQTITQQNGRWVVVTPKGLIVSMR